MNLAPKDVERVIRLNRQLMMYVFRKLWEIEGLRYQNWSDVPVERQRTVRTEFAANPDIIRRYVEQNPDKLSAADLAVVSSWRHCIAGKFVVMRETATHTILQEAEGARRAFAVKGLQDRIVAILNQQLPCIVYCILLPYEGHITYDGLLEKYNLAITPKMAAFLEHLCKTKVKSDGLFSRFVDGRPVASSFELPPALQLQPTHEPITPPLVVPLFTREPAATAPSEPVKKKKAAAKRTAKKAAATPKSEADVVLQAVLDLIEPFCRDRLNPEYAEMCRKLAEKLARKRPSPLLKGRVNTWATGIVRTIGWVNFLDDRTQSPHMRMPEIDKAFGVGESTGQGKAKEIRKLLKIRDFDLEWTLPSRRDDNPNTWMINVNGFVLDARILKLEYQEEAFRQGLIPYVPGERKTT